MKEVIFKLLFLIVGTVRLLTLRLSPQCPLYFETFISLSQTVPLIPSDTDARKGVRAAVLKLDFKVYEMWLRHQAY